MFFKSLIIVFIVFLTSCSKYNWMGRQIKKGNVKFYSDSTGIIIWYEGELSIRAIDTSLVK